jgi:hypothetical protein
LPGAERESFLLARCSDPAQRDAVRAEIEPLLIASSSRYSAGLLQRLNATDETVR